MTPIWPLLRVQTGSQSVIYKNNHISTTTRGKFNIFPPSYRSLIVKKYLYKSDPNLTFTSSPNRKSKFNISQNHISTTARGKFTFFAPLYRSLIVKIYLQKGDPNLTFTSCPNQKSKFNIKKKHISTTKRRKFTIFCTIVQIVNFQKYLQKGEPFLTFTSCPNPTSKFDISKNHMSTTRRNQFTICTIVQTVNCQKIIYTIFYSQCVRQFLHSFCALYSLTCNFSKISLMMSLHMTTPSYILILYSNKLFVFCNTF